MATQVTTPDAQGVTVPPASPPSPPQDTPQDAASAPVSAPVAADSPTPQPQLQDAPEPRPQSHSDQRVPLARMNQVTREKHEALRRAEEAERRLAELQASQAPIVSTADGQALDPVAIDRLVQTRAHEIANIQEFNRRCDAVAQKGKAEIPDFDQAIAGFQPFGGLGAYPEFVDTVTRLEEAPKLLHHLGTHLDEAERILQLRGAAQGLELGRLAARLASQSAPTPKLTSAPAPVAPVRGAAQPTPGPDDKGQFSDQETYRKWREANWKKH